MTPEQVVVVARVRAREGAEEELKRALLSTLVPSRAEAGNIEFLIHRGVDDASVFVSYEKWASREDLNRHLQTPHLKAFMERAGELLAAPPEITLLEILEPESSDAGEGG